MILDSDRPAREEYYEEETEKVVEAIRNRGDQRIGQLILNLVRSQNKKNYYAEYDFDDVETAEEVQEKRNKALRERKTDIYNKLWNIEADELAMIIEEHEHHGGEKE